MEEDTQHHTLPSKNTHTNTPHIQRERQRYRVIKMGTERRDRKRWTETERQKDREGERATETKV